MFSGEAASADKEGSTQQSVQSAAVHPQPKRWLDSRRSADERADLLAGQMTQAEKILLIQGENFGGTAGKLEDLTRFGIPVLLQADAVATIINLNRKVPGVMMAGAIADGASFDISLSRDRGAALGAEAHAQGIGILLHPAGNLVRDPRGGRTGEYYGEDPLLSGKMMAASVRGIQSKSILATVKHFGINGWESQRKTVDMQISEAQARESDLLAFEIAITEGEPAAVMCAYPWLNGVPSCASKYLLTDLLRRDWGFKGFVMTDWDAFQDTVVSAQAGLDIQSGFLPSTNPINGMSLNEFAGGGFNDGRSELPKMPFGPGSSKPYFADLESAIESGRVPQSVLDQKVHNILRAIFASGIVERPPVPAPLGTVQVRNVAQRQIEEGAVLLKNRGDLLPLRKGLRIAVIGQPAAGPPKGVDLGPFAPPAAHGLTILGGLKARFGNLISFVDGKDLEAAAALAARSDLALVFVESLAAEGKDLASLMLPNEQNRLVKKVAAANARTAVISQNTNPFFMPWLDYVDAVLVAWKLGDNGGDAVARILAGEVNPSGRLPITFPKDATQLVRRDIPGFNRGGMGGLYSEITQVPLIEGANVGYKWYEQKRITPLFRFGYGLSYSRFALSKPQLIQTSSGAAVKVTVTNLSAREGKNVVQFYVTPPGGVRRLAAFAKPVLQAHGKKELTFEIEKKALAMWTEGQHCWSLPPGEYRVHIQDGQGGETALRLHRTDIYSTNDPEICR
jgi:beta-glucosidase